MVINGRLRQEKYWLESLKFRFTLKKAYAHISWILSKSSDT